MKWIPVFVFLIFTNQLLANQLEQLVNSSIKEQQEVNINKLLPNQLAISMPFSNQLILNPGQKLALQEKIVIKIELVYTKFRTSPTFDQKLLNHNRLVELKKLVPNLFENPLWDFELISQTNGNSQSECNAMFHGFIITFRPNSTNNTLVQEVEYLDKIVAQLIKKGKKDSIPDKMTYDIKTRWDNVIGYVHDTVWKINEEEQIPPPDFFYNHSLFKDSTVINAFNRNKTWKNFIVVTDVTGSMSPYIAQVFVWLKEQTENNNAKYFVFFNDGDDKESRQKKPLKTAGIYGGPNNGLDAVMQKAALCMKNGSGGGEGLENDVEAILFGQEAYESADEIILIADNFESMRDYKFLDQIKKPVRIIICGARARVNIEYLDLARITRGSIHTTNSDVFDLSSVKKNQTITIDGQSYLFYNDRFNFVY
ncbi:MAG: hypothetical protein AB7O47_00205 [Flavobacteriales bacterium]